VRASSDTAPAASAGQTADRAAAAPAASAEETVALPAGVDLHARPAAQFVRAAMGFSARIVVTAGERDADAKSLLSVLALGATGGTALLLRADGDDAPAAVSTLAGCLGALVD
jgi:phosphotransferase system HPr (HPr) family protein